MASFIVQVIVVVLCFLWSPVAGVGALVGMGVFWASPLLRRGSKA
jgi:hypothetical protein